MTDTPVLLDLAVTGAVLVTDAATFAGDIGVLDGRIAMVTAPGSLPAARETLDARGLHLMPGAIDAHVHVREPGYTHKEDWETGTAAAAMGGVTTIFEMPNTNPPTGTPEALAVKREATKKAHVDFGLYGLLAEDNLDQLDALVAGGVAAFKCFMGNTFGNLPSPSTGAMLEGFEIVARHGLRISLHAETASIMALRQKKLMAAGKNAPLDHLASRPAVVATEAVARACILSEWTGARIHILHISSADELGPLRDAKARGVDVTGETCPHYLLLDEHAYAKVGSIVRVNPPVRERHHQEGVWAGLLDGTIDMIATDHAPHDPAEKVKDVIWQADCGFIGVETQMPLMLSQVNAGRLTLQDYVRMASVAPAKAFGLYPRKGSLLPGADADFTLIDLSSEDEIRASRLHSRSRITPFEGWRVKGLPVHTLVRGRLVMKNRALVSDTKGWGACVSRVQQMPLPAPRHVDQTTAAVTGSSPAPGGSR